MIYMNFEKIIGLLEYNRNHDESDYINEYDDAISFLRARASEPSAQEIREFCENNISSLISPIGLFEGHNSFTKGAYKEVINFIEKAKCEKVANFAKNIQFAKKRLTNFAKFDKLKLSASKSPKIRRYT